MAGGGVSGRLMVYVCTCPPSLAFHTVASDHGAASFASYKYGRCDYVERFPVLPNETPVQIPTVRARNILKYAQTQLGPACVMV